jgi:cytochrome P450
VNTPSTTIDLWTDEALSDPYPLYAELREIGPIVWMETHDTFVITHFEPARAALRAWSTFASGNGVFMNDPTNEALAGRAMLCTDGERHTRLRRVVAAPLTPKALEEVRGHIDIEAAALVQRLVDAGRFDAATDLAEYLPVEIVSSLVGVPEAGRERMIEWATAAFNASGPLNERCLASLPMVSEMTEFIEQHCVPGQLRPGGWADSVWRAADAGQLEPYEPPSLMNDYMAPALDTTINATTNLVWLLAHHPDQWDLLRSDPTLIPNAIEEALRLESPIQSFSRSTTEDTVVAGVDVPAGSRVLILFGAANRDPLAFESPDTFDIARSSANSHLALGHGRHACPGGHVARLEIRALMSELVQRVEQLQVVEEHRRLNNSIRGLDRLVVDVTTSADRTPSTTAT